ncbi:peptide deformylase [Patescibacteria group bacterium]|nr:MAG: peptide deformylase [Patescibacteria group bacterium]
MIDPIVENETPILRETLKPVPKNLFGTAELRDIIKRMSTSLRTTKFGVAIAANQIGIDYRIFVVRGFVLENKEKHTEANAQEDVDRAFINPKIVKVSRKKDILTEACLSVPGFSGTIKRSLQATVRAYDEEGIRFERGGSGLLAQIFQHETDHLDGILYIDKAEEVHASNDLDEPNNE